jgi:integrase
VSTKTKTLTAKFVDGVKPTAKRAEYFDANVRGLALRVTPAGAKSWTLFYRHRGRLRRLTLGDLDALTLAQARERARDELYKASKGEDVAQTKQDARKADTVADLAKLYIEKWAKPKKKSWKQDDNLIRKKVLPAWKHRAIADIKRADVRNLVDNVAETAPVVANRVVSLLSKMFAFALDSELLTASPAVRITKPGKEKQRDRVLTESELRTLWAELEALDTPMAAFYRLRLLTAQRAVEVSGMRWQDVDLESGWWTIPAEMAKNGLAHRVPLNASAGYLLAALYAVAHKDAVYVLGAHSRRAGEGARGRRQQSEAAATFTIENFRGHDLRRTAASLMTGGGIARLTVGKILNHSEKGITKVYDRHSYDAEKLAALTWWDLKLRSIIDNKPGTVLPFVRVS